MSLGNSSIHQRGEIPEITKLPNGRIRVVRRFYKFTREDVDNVNLGSLMGDFGDLDTTDEQITNQGYTNCRLISSEVDTRVNSVSNDENPLLVQTYETLTSTFVETTDPTVEISESGLKKITKVFRAISGTTSSNVVGTSTLATGEILASSQIEDSTAFAELTEIYFEAGIRKVSVDRDSDSQLVSVECIGLTESDVSTELQSLIGDHELTSETTQDVDGFETKVFTYKIKDLTTLETTSDDLNLIRKIELSETVFASGVINSTQLTFDGDVYTLRKEEINNVGIIKKRSRIFALYDSVSFPSNTLFEIDRTYGIALPVARQIIPAATATGSIGATEALQVEPVDSFRSLSYKILKSDADQIPTQVWYEKRNVSVFPSELSSVSIVGTQNPTVVVNYKEPPQVGLVTKITRKFHWGVPANSGVVIGNNYRPQPFSGAIEVEVLRESSSQGTSNSESSNQGTSSNTSESTSNSQGTSSNTSTSQTDSSSTSTSSGASSGTSSVTSSGESNVSSSGTSSGASSTTTDSASQGTNTTSNTGSSTSSGQSTSNSTGDSSNTGNSSVTSSGTNNSTSTSSSSNTGTSSGTNNVTSSNSGSSTSSGSSNTTSNSTSSSTSTSSGTSTSSSTGTSTRTVNSTMTTDVTSTGTDEITSGSSDRQTQSKIDSVPNAATPIRYTEVSGIVSDTAFSKTSNNTNQTDGNSSTDSTQTGSGDSSSTRNSSGTNNSTGNNTFNSSGNSTSNNTSNSTSNGSSTSNNTANVTSSGTTGGTSTSTSTSSGTSSNTSSSTSTSSGNFTSNNTGTSSGTSTGTSTSTSTGSSDSTNASTSTSSSDNSSTSTSTSNNSGTSSSSTSSTSSGTSNNTSVSSGVSIGTSDGTSVNETLSESTSSTLSKTVISVNLRPCLRTATSVTFDGKTISIPATVPTSIPRDTFIEIERSSSHWKYNIWVEQIVEVKLPA